MFDACKKVWKKVCDTASTLFSSLFSRAQIDLAALEELKRILVAADVGNSMSNQLVEKVEKQLCSGTIVSGADLRLSLKQLLVQQLESARYDYTDPEIIMLVGVNGSGKTTAAAKLAWLYKNKGKKVLLVAADTFRAAAVAQLEQWAHSLDVSIVAGKEKQDPASVVYAAAETFKTGGYDLMIVDTAGRLQTKVNLMHELNKIKRSIDKQLPGKTLKTLLVLDSMLGQNSVIQAEEFNGATTLDGIVLTKVDGTAKGGVVFAIGERLAVPVAYLCFGEQRDDLKLFDGQEFVDALVG